MNLRIEYEVRVSVVHIILRDRHGVRVACALVPKFYFGEETPYAHHMHDLFEEECHH